ncbi:MAG: glycosyltransferase family 4 protein, partial [Gemmatimonadales bacterium]
MRILSLCYEFPPLGGGGARVVHGLSRELVRLGHEVDVVTMGRQGLPRREDVHGVQVYRVPCVRRALHVCTAPEAFSYLLGALPVALKLAKHRRYDLNHTHFIFPDGVIAW